MKELHINYQIRVKYRIAHTDDVNIITVKV